MTERSNGCHPTLEDMAVVGFDDLATVAEATEPPLTTVHQDIEAMGRLMARPLFKRTTDESAPRDSGPPPPSVVTPTRSAVRKTA